MKTPQKTFRRFKSYQVWLRRLLIEKLDYQRLEPRQLLASIHGGDGGELASNPIDTGVEIHVRVGQDQGFKKSLDAHRSNRDASSQLERRHDRGNRQPNGLQPATTQNSTFQTSTPNAIASNSNTVPSSPIQTIASSQPSSQSLNVVQAQGLAGSTSTSALNETSNFDTSLALQLDTNVGQADVLASLTQPFFPANINTNRATNGGNASPVVNRGAQIQFPVFRDSSQLDSSGYNNSDKRIKLHLVPALSVSEPTMLIGEIDFDSDADFRVDEFFSLFELKRDFEIDPKSKLTDRLNQPFNVFQTELESLQSLLSELHDDPESERTENTTRSDELFQSETNPTQVTNEHEVAANEARRVDLDDVSNGGMVMLGLEEDSVSDEIDELIQFLAEGMKVELPISNSQIEMSVGVVQGFDVGCREQITESVDNIATPIPTAD